MIVDTYSNMSVDTAKTAHSPLVSIGVPVHNAERFLAQALESLLNQSFSNFELIISDNASTDGTQAICEDFARRDKRVRYIRQKYNFGAPRNWNYVVHEARGEFFKWASANDYCAPNMIEKCVAVLLDNPKVVLCYGRTCFVDEETGEQQEYEGDFAVLKDHPHERFKMLYRKLYFNHAQCGLIRLDTLRRTRLDRPYPSGDKVLLAELALQGQFLLLQDILLYRRKGSNSHSGMLTASEKQRFFYPQKPREISLIRFRLHADYLATVLRASLSPSEKFKTLLSAVKHMSWDRNRLWMELRRALFKNWGQRHV